MTDTETAVDELAEADEIEATKPEDDSATPAEEAGDESPDQDDSDTEDSDEGEAEEEEKPKPKRRRDNRLANARARNAALEHQLAEMQRVAAQQPAEEVAPKQSDFATYEEFAAASQTHLARKATREEMQRIARDAQAGVQQQQVAQIEAEWTAKEDAAREKYADYDEVARADGLQISAHMADAMKTDERGAELAYWLGNHPDEAARISRMPTPAASVFELGKIAGSKLGKKPAPKLPGQPDPVKPLRPRGSGSNTDPSKAKSMDDFVRLRRKQMESE